MPTPIADEPPPPPGATAKAGFLLAVLAVLVVGSLLFVLAARGAFEPTQRLVLVADDSEGVSVGMDLTFSGFPIGRVRRIELGADGSARILVDVPVKDAHWLRQSSVFTLVRSVVGGTAIRAYSGVLADPPLADGAERRVLVGDATAEIPQLVAATRELIANLSALSAGDAALAATLAQLRTTAERLNGPRGALGLLLGNEADARRVVALLERSRAVLDRLDTTVARADEQLLGPQGLVPETQASVRELGALLGEARASLRRLDAILVDTQAITGSTKAATADLAALRAQVDASLRKVEAMLAEMKRRGPFAREPELTLP